MDLDVDLNDAIPLEPDPIADAALEHARQLSEPVPCRNPGLTKREEYVKAAMQGIAANHMIAARNPWIVVADEAVILADATIAAMNKERAE